MRHFIPVEIAYPRYPALAKLDSLDSYTAFSFNVLVYIVWQFLYYYFIVIAKKDKIQKGERINSYSTMTQGKGAVANLLNKAKPNRREPAFMLLQFVYTIVTTASSNIAPYLPVLSYSRLTNRNCCFSADSCSAHLFPAQAHCIRLRVSIPSTSGVQIS